MLHKKSVEHTRHLSIKCSISSNKPIFKIFKKIILYHIILYYITLYYIMLYFFISITVTCFNNDGTEMASLRFDIGSIDQQQ